jgi:DNA replication and repair protein RecF
VHLISLSVLDFRNIADATVGFDAQGTTVITGPNGAGKTNLLEAVAYVGSLRSFRGAPREAMVRRGRTTAVVRAEAEAGPRPVTIEAELRTEGRSRTMVNRQAVRRRSDLHEALRTTVFSPHDITIVQGGPSDRRGFLDETLEVVDPKSARAIEEVDRILRQRAALLKNAHRQPTGEVDSSLEVWDQRLDDAGTRLVDAREQLLEQLAPRLTAHYDRLSGRASSPTARYRRSWSGSLADALVSHRQADLARGLTSVGPHRDEVELDVGGLPARTHISQGEQRSLALALRLAGHQLATERLGEAPVLLLDDVFSELDEARRRALMAGLPLGQTLLTTAVSPPSEVEVSGVLQVAPGGVVRPGEPRS